MTKQIREYLALLEQFFSTEHSAEEMAEMKKKLLQRIAFYQHERLIHLIITMSFAVFMLISLFMWFVTGNWGTIALSAVLLIMLAFYIKHYYFLENSVQKMYLFYYKIESVIDNR